ncbi:major facilitator superfamily domain-containing protein [Tricladium varicosporioides]|nr:major facilitator superfamily domain-containing protein [Hymenoscyphus varicosporioides]
MGFGVLEPKLTTGEHVPGTALIYDDGRGTEEGTAVQATLKRDNGKNSDIILVPQPSDSPNDPLNWPKWKKNMAYFSICYSTMMGGSLGPIMSPATGVIAKEFHVTISRAALPGGYPLLSAGIGAFLLQAWAPVLGKRSAYIASTALLFVTTVWSAQIPSSNFNELLACRTLQGFGNGAYESIVISTIGDLFFVHERGKRIVIYQIGSLGCASITPILGGYITDKYGWRMQFNILIAFTGIAFLVIIFCCPETTYNRPIIYETDVRSTEGLTTPEGGTSEKAVTTTSEEAPEIVVITEKPRTYWEELKPFNGLITRQNPLILLARPFACFLLPAVFWGFTVGGLWSSWTIGLAIVVAQLFSPPPNLFTPTKLGFLFVFPFLFVLVGSLFGVFLSDWWPKWCARRNKGIFEPEFRLILLVPVLFIGIPAIFGFGYYASRPDVNWVASSCLQGLISFSTVLAASTSVEVSVAIIMLRNFFWFGSSYFLPAWLEASKTWKVFDIIASLQLGVTLCSILIYIFGKRLRHFFHQHDPLKLFHLI